MAEPCTCGKQCICWCNSQRALLWGALAGIALFWLLAIVGSAYAAETPLPAPPTTVERGTLGERCWAEDDGRWLCVIDPRQVQIPLPPPEPLPYQVQMERDGW